jgi:hypothetical protein
MSDKWVNADIPRKLLHTPKTNFRFAATLIRFALSSSVYQPHNASEVLIYFLTILFASRFFVF